MLVLALHRLFQSVLVLFFVGLIAFSLFQFVGDPIENMLGQERTEADVIYLRDQLGLDDPIAFQYFRFLGNALQGEFGISYKFSQPVDELIRERLPATLELAAVSGVFALLFGVLFGV